jgi:GalNAc-alpha-(1->4)-GalNAc-alpha-(1->3)-diNAcBac-PP-undecaprenol alpha-1,4-N-acetyl-D-galactosaminyltransferase
MVISSLSAGGAERVLVLLCRGLTGLGHHVSVVTVFGTEGDFYSLPDGVDRVALDVGKTTHTTAERLTANARRITALRRALRRVQPDVVISFMTETNVLVLLAALGLRVPVIVTEHSDPRKKRMKRIWKGLRRATYRRASRVVSVSPGVDDFFAWLPESKRAVIGNPIVLSEIHAESGEPLSLGWRHSVIAMGRLEPEKGFDVLVAALARLAAEFPDWGLVILGEGGERGKLESLISELGLGQRVQLPGVVENPFPTMRRADLFVLSSRTESFGNALLEAMACGLPVIATQCWSRSPEWVRDGVTGLVVPTEDPASLAAAMARLMADAGLRKRLAAEASKGVERFDLDEISRTWDELLGAVVAVPKPRRGRRD